MREVAKGRWVGARVSGGRLATGGEIPALSVGAGPAAFWRLLFSVKRTHPGLGHVKVMCHPMFGIVDGVGLSQDMAR